MNIFDFERWMRARGFSYTAVSDNRNRVREGRAISAPFRRLLHHYYVSHSVHIAAQLSRASSVDQLPKELVKAFKLGILSARELSAIMKAYTRNSIDLPEQTKRKTTKGGSQASSFSMIEVDDES
jgi:hypothetical protein